jgi:hypothetical protein
VLHEPFSRPVLSCPVNNDLKGQVHSTAQALDSRVLFALDANSAMAKKRKATTNQSAPIKRRRREGQTSMVVTRSFLYDESHQSAAFSDSPKCDVHSFGANAASKEKVNEYEQAC